MKRTSVVVSLFALSSLACSKAASPQQVTQSDPAVKETKDPAKDPARDPANANDTAKNTPNAAPEEDGWGKAPVVKKDPIARPLLWSATKAGKTTYFLGTMHMGVDAELRLPKLVWDKLDAAPVFAMETDTTDPAILGMGRRTSGTLRGDLGPVYWKKLEALIEPMILQGLDRMKPTMAAAVLSLRGLPMTPPMDGVLLSRATDQKKQIVYLEPAMKQATLLEKWMDVRMLKMMIDDPAGGLASTKDMLEAYTSGDEAKMLALAESQKQSQLKNGITAAEFEASMEALLYERNASWIEGIEKLHTRGHGFVAVGALHLVGPKSVLDLLAAKGYKVARLTP